MVDLLTFGKGINLNGGEGHAIYSMTCKKHLKMVASCEISDLLLGSQCPHSDGRGGVDKLLPDTKGSVSIWDISYLRHHKQ